MPGFADVPHPSSAAGEALGPKQVIPAGSVDGDTRPVEDVVLLCVIGARFAVPLLIPRYPLPAEIGALVLDAADQTIFQLFGYDPPGYQGYDKAMDVYYLAIVYLSTMRNWDNLAAFRVGQVLYYYRLAGVVLFELTHARPILLLFPNTFEYFFIAYELVRTRWSPRTISMRTWVITAGAIWVFVKLPQEWWLHVAELDVTDTLRKYDWALPLLAVLLLAAAAVLWFVVRPRLPRPDYPLRIAADPMPAAVATAAARGNLRLVGDWVWSWMTAEKIVLLGLLSVIYSRILPDLDVSGLRVFVVVGAFVLANAAITLAASRREWTHESATAAVAARLMTNVGIVLLASALLDVPLLNADTFFFLCLISLITTLHDRYQPALAYREREAAARTT